MNRYVNCIMFALLLSFCITCAVPQSNATEAHKRPTAHETELEIATFGGGCFWCMEGPFEKLEGVNKVISGYTGGVEKNPTYKQVSRGTTGHTEAVQITFDPTLMTYERLLETYWKNIDPTDSDGQFADRGPQYRPGIFYHNSTQKRAAEISKSSLEESGIFQQSIAVEITAYRSFYPAKDHHQDYYLKNPEHYNAYKKGSGRKGFLERNWSEK